MIRVRANPVGRRSNVAGGPSFLALAGALLLLACGAPSADAQGVAEITVPVGLVQVTAKTGLQDGAVTVAVEEGGTVTAEITLPAAP